MGPYVLDEDFSNALAECKKLLHVSPDSIIVIKDNVCDIMKARDKEGVHRTQEQWEDVFDAAGLEIYDQQLQQNWPKKYFLL